MRTTLDIDPDLLELLRERAFRTEKSFKETVNVTLRRGIRAESAKPTRSRRYRCPSVSLGKPLVDLDKSMAVASNLEDDESVRDLQLRK